ncbi:unnamed protein product [Rotaria magnacalcarata]
MLSFLLLSLLVGVGASSYGCPTNVTCVAKETCCQTDTGLWACCPMEDGLCCDDGLHCCSKGQTCLPTGQCSSNSNDISPAFILEVRQNQISAVPCPDGSSCPDGNTCCQLSSGKYGCCPIVDAVCCSDHLHCCPQGVPCPGGSSACPDGQTCCQLESGEYGCCPLADAVCCSDHLHCCPHGYTCDVEKGQCNQEISIPWFTKTPAFPRKQKLVDVIDDKETDMHELISSSNPNAQIICPDGTSLCPSTSTCCLSPESIWGCCPVENAVCCSDHKHCCPQHYKCDLHIFKCDHLLFGSIPILRKQSSVNSILSNVILSNVESTISTIQCPDEKSLCPEETTCCELKNGAYGCCPYSQASCCSDKIHCCGNGYSCDESSKRCIRHFDSLNKTDIIPSARKLVALKKKENTIQRFYPLSPLKDQQCPDGKTICSPNSTCCPNKENDQITYSCCPYSKGVCCGSNGAVCCPNGYICDEQQLSCQLSNLILVREAPPNNDYNRCGTSEVACSYDQTCCRTYGSADGEYACCGFPDAQCCEDGRHCCPRGSRCDVQSEDFNNTRKLSLEQQIQIIITRFNNYFHGDDEIQSFHRRLNELSFNNNISTPSTILEVDETQTDSLFQTLSSDSKQIFKSLTTSTKSGQLHPNSSMDSVKYTQFLSPFVTNIRQRRVIHSILLHVQTKQNKLEKIIDTLKFVSIESKIYQLGLEFLRDYDGKFNYPEGHTLVMILEKRTCLLTIEKIKCVECRLGESEPRSLLMLSFEFYLFFSIFNNPYLISTSFIQNIS